MRIGKVISSSLAPNRDGEKPVLLLKVEITDPEDLQTVELGQAGGEDYNPAPDTTVIIADLGEAWKIAIAADDGVLKSAAVGEKEIYAQSGGLKKGSLHCKKDGTVEAKSGTLVPPPTLDFVAQSGKVHSEISQMLQAGAGAGGPGAANFTAAKTYWDLIFAPPLTGVASSNLKGED